MLRSAYRTKVRFFANDPREVEIRWYRCLPDAEVMPVHAFASRNWLSEPEVDTVIGEVRGAQRPWDGGRTPLGATGGHYCGTPDEWSTGVQYPPATTTAYDVEGLPLCCNAGNPPDVEDALRDINFWRQVGGAGLDVFYLGGSVTGQGQSPSLAEPDTIHCLPLFAARGGTVDKLAVWLQTVGSMGAVVRAAIYEATSETDLRPDALVAETGDFAMDVLPLDWKFSNIGVTLDPLKLYWLCVNASNVAVMPIIGAMTSVFYFNVFGFDQNTFTPYFGLKVPFPYGPFPANFPAVTQAHLANGVIEAVGIAYSS